MKNFITNALLVFFSFAVGLVFLEFTLRFIYSMANTGAPSSVSELPRDEALGFRYVPGGVIPGTTADRTFDQRGFVNKDVLSNYEIVALGDSHTEGREEGGLHESWPETLSRLSGKSVYNMGLSGYGIASYRYLLTSALEFHPKMIVVGLYIGNDIFDAYNLVYHLAPSYWESYQLPEFVDDEPIGVNDLDGTQVRWKGFRDYLHEHMALYGFVSQATRNLREKVGLATPHYTGTTNWADPRYDVGLLYDDSSDQETVFLVGTRFTPIDLQNKSIQEGVRLTSVLLGEMAEEASAASTTLVIAIIPTKSRVYYDRVSEKAETNTLYSKAVKNEDEIRAKISDICMKTKVLCIDLLPAMQAALDRGDTVYPHSIDDHPNVGGYRLYGEAIWAGLERAGLMK